MIVRENDNIVDNLEASMMQFPDELRIYPDDACLHSLHQILASKQANPVQVQYI